MAYRHTIHLYQYNSNNISYHRMKKNVAIFLRFVACLIFNHKILGYQRRWFWMWLGPLCQRPSCGGSPFRWLWWKPSNLGDHGGPLSAGLGTLGWVEIWWGEKWWFFCVLKWWVVDWVLRLSSRPTWVATWILEHAGTGPVSESFESCGGKQFVFTSKKGVNIE